MVKIFEKKAAAAALILILAGPGIVSISNADGLPGEYLLSSQWRALFTYYSPLVNPAFMMEQAYTSIRGVTSVSTDDVSQLWEVGVIQPVGLYHTIGLSWIAENGYQVSDGRFASDTFVSRESTNNHNTYVMASYAYNLWGGLNVGVNLNGAYQSNFGEPSYGFGADIGLSYRLLLSPLFGFHLIGATYQNVVQPNLALYMDMPNSPQAKLIYHGSLLQDRINFDVQVNVRDFLVKIDNFVTGDKFYEYNTSVQLALWPIKFIGLKGFAEIGDSKSLEFWGAACAMNVPHVNDGRDFEFVYQYRDRIRSELMGSHSIYFRMDVGKNREELASRTIARNISLSANELYNRAMKLYFKKEYWDAYFIFQRILADFPDFFKNDLVEYYSGSCLEEMDMREEAIRTYDALKTSHPISGIVPNADLGLMRIYYRQGQYTAINNQYGLLNVPNVPDSIRAHAHYLMGETELQQGNNRQALGYFDIVPEGHPAYLFAQHSSAIAHVLMGSGMHLVVSSLENCISSKAESPAEKEAVSRSYLFLGYIFYEEGSLSKAVVALRMIPATSYYYQDALLGLGWSGIKARQWADVINSGQMLATMATYTVVQCEGALIEAYGNLLQKQYEAAMAILKPAVDKIKDCTAFNPDSVQLERMRYESNRMQYAFLAEKVGAAARLGGMAEKQANIDSLHAQQTGQKQKLEEYMKFSDFVTRFTFFGRNAGAVKEDLEYALATLQKILKTSDVMKVQEKMINKDKQITDEIEKLKEQMQKIEPQK